MNPPAPVTKMRGFPVTQTPAISDWDGEPLFYRTFSVPSKLTLGFQKRKDKFPVPTFVCKTVHWCVTVFGTKEPYSFIVIAVRLFLIGMETAGEASVSPSLTLNSFGR